MFTRRWGVHRRSTVKVPPWVADASCEGSSTQPLAKASTSTGDPRLRPPTEAVQPALMLCPSTSSKGDEPGRMPETASCMDVAFWCSTFTRGAEGVTAASSWPYAATGAAPPPGAEAKRDLVEVDADRLAERRVERVGAGAEVDPSGVRATEGDRQRLAVQRGRRRPGDRHPHGCSVHGEQVVPARRGDVRGPCRRRPGRGCPPRRCRSAWRSRSARSSRPSSADGWRRR